MQWTDSELGKNGEKKVLLIQSYGLIRSLLLPFEGDQRDGPSSRCASGGTKLSVAGGLPLPEQVRHRPTIKYDGNLLKKRIKILISYV